MKVKMAVWGILTSVGQSNCEPPVPCAFSSFEAVIARSNWSLWRFSHITLPCLGAVRAGDGYTASAHGQSCDNNDIVSFNSR